MNNSPFIQDTIFAIEKSIQSNTFIDVERSKVELKDLSTGNDWKSLKETICAFLNTDGGIVICGVREKDKQYSLTGFNRNNESKIIELQSKTFTDDNEKIIDFSDNIYFDYYSLLNKDVVVISIFPLSKDLKYVAFEKKFFERKLTQDKEIPLSKIQKQREYKQEVEYAKEISIIENSTTNDLSLDKINKYVTLLNQEIRNETLKPSLVKAKPFLIKQHFLKDDKITILGLLVCGDDPFTRLGSKAEVNCYFDTASEISRDKKIFRNDVISMMEDTFRYIWGNIRIGRILTDGGKSEPEYPEKLVREIINNALAHRDYTIEGFVTVTVEPQKWLEIKNPGSFKEKMKVIHTESDIPIRRLVPGIPESKNPKLASVLKVFDKIENQGRGMASLINATLDNLTDIPYYEIKDDIICLRIPSGKLVDETIENWINGFQNYIINKIKRPISNEHKQILAYFYKSEKLNKLRFFTILLSESNNHAFVIEELKTVGLLIEHSASTEENPIYIIDRVLFKTNYQEELLDLIGNDYIYFDEVAKEILNILYQYTVYNNTGLKPSEVYPEVYRRIYGKIINPKTFESLGRKVRSICSKLMNDKILLRNKQNSYLFNLNYKFENKLF